MTPDDIKTFRAARGLSQADLAAKLGVDQATVSRAERGTPLPKSAGLLLDMLTGAPDADDSAARAAVEGQSDEATA